MTYTTSQATVARGIVVQIGAAVIAEVLDDGVPIPQTETDDIEVTNQDSGDWKEYKAGRKDGGECEIKCNAVDGDAGQVALAAAAAAGSTSLFTVTFPSNSVLTFYGTVKTFDHIVEDQILKISAKIKVSGKPAYSTTMAALTSLATSVGTLFPTFSGTTYKYVVDVITGTTSVTVTPTKSSSTITVNGTTVTSGVASGAITLGAAGTLTDITVVVAETGKANAIYTLTIKRAAS